MQNQLLDAESAAEFSERKSVVWVTDGRGKDTKR